MFCFLWAFRWLRHDLNIKSLNLDKYWTPQHPRVAPRGVGAATPFIGRHSDLLIHATTLWAEGWALQRQPLGAAALVYCNPSQFSRGLGAATPPRGISQRRLKESPTDLRSAAELENEGCGTPTHKFPNLKFKCYPNLSLFYLLLKPIKRSF